MTGVHSIRRAKSAKSAKLIPPAMPTSLDVIFERDRDGQPTKNAILLRYILRYGEYQWSDKKNSGFRFTDLGNWLIGKVPEFYEYYRGFDAKLAPSKRLANTRNRINRKIEELIHLGLMYIREIVIAERNDEKIPLYDYTNEGYLLIWIIESTFKDYEISEKNSKVNMDSSLTIQNILDIIGSYTMVNDSCNLLFITKFFNKCRERRVFSNIIGFFMHKIFPSLKITSGRELLLSFLGINNTLNWLLAQPQIFREALLDIDDEARKLVLFSFKMQIEDYYAQNYSKEALLIADINDMWIRSTKDPTFCNERNNSLAVPGKEWEIARLNNIQECSKVTLPGFCYECKSERPFTIDILRYFDFIIAAQGPYPSRLVSGDCIRCGKNTASTHVMRFIYFTSPWM
jgi:hypothetical protein